MLRCCKQLSLPAINCLITIQRSVPSDCVVDIGLSPKVIDTDSNVENEEVLADPHSLTVWQQNQVWSTDSGIYNLNPIALVNR